MGIRLTLREEILAGRNFGGSAHPPNPMQFGGIYFGVSGKILYLAGINFGEFADNQCSVKCFDKEKGPK